MAPGDECPLEGDEPPKNNGGEDGGEGAGDNAPKNRDGLIIGGLLLGTLGVGACLLAEPYGAILLGGRCLVGLPHNQ